MDERFVYSINDFMKNYLQRSIRAMFEKAVLDPGTSVRLLKGGVNLTEIKGLI